MNSLTTWFLAAVVVGWLLVMQGCAQAPVYRLQDISCSWLRPIELSEQATSDPMTDEEILLLFADNNLDGLSSDMLRVAHDIEYKHALTLEDFYKLNSLNDAIAANCGYTSEP